LSTLAAVRPDEWNLPLFLHILGSMVLTGSMLLAATVLLSSWRSGSVTLARTGYRTLLIGVLPSWLLTRIAAQVIANKEGLDKGKTPTWVTIGFITTEPGLLLIVAATVAAGLGLRKARRDGGTLGASRKVAAVLTSLLVVFYVVAIWAMTAKPS